MGDQNQHVFTEISLALCMVFFCLMVLALVSFGGQDSQAEVIDLSSQSRAASTGDAQGRWVIFHKGRFYDTDLALTEPNSHTKERIMLAVPSNVSLDQVMSARSKIFSPDVSIALLDQRWMNRLEELQ